MMNSTPAAARVSRRMRLGVFVVLVLVAGAVALRADRTGYSEIVELRSVDRDLIVTHHHDWTARTREARYRMISSHQDPFRNDNTYASLTWSASDGRVLRRVPGPALTWIGFSNDGRYVIGLSDIKLWNPYQLVVYDRQGRLLLKRGVTQSLACMSRDRYEALRKTPRGQERKLQENAWVVRDTVYVDYLDKDLPRSLETALSGLGCAWPWAPVSESVTNWVRWFDERHPAPEIVEVAGAPTGVRFRNVNGEPFVMPFKLETPSH
jgi:hypothetical protein